MGLTVQKCQDFDMAHQLLERVKYRISTCSGREVVNATIGRLHLDFRNCHATTLSAWDYMAEWRQGNRIPVQALPKITIGEWMLWN